MNSVLDRLTGGDLRSEGAAEQVADDLIGDPGRLPELFEGLSHEDKLIRGRTCMTAEWISRSRPDLLASALPAMIGLARADTVAQVRWHLAEVFGNVPLPVEAREGVIAILLAYLEDPSKIVRYCAVQTLGVVSGDSPRLAEVVQRIEGVSKDSKGLAKAARIALAALAGG